MNIMGKFCLQLLHTTGRSVIEHHNTRHSTVLHPCTLSFTVKPHFTRVKTANNGRFSQSYSENVEIAQFIALSTIYTSPIESRLRGPLGAKS